MIKIKMNIINDISILKIHAIIMHTSQGNTLGISSTCKWIRLLNLWIYQGEWIYTYSHVYIYIYIYICLYVYICTYKYM